MKSLTGLWSELARDCANQCGTSVEKDIDSVLSRVETEGDSFLTITLPNFAQSFEEALELGSIQANHFIGFKKWRRLPAFLRGFVELVFDPGTGLLRTDPSVAAVRCVRQLTLIFKKIERETTSTRKAKAEEKYIQTEIDLRKVDESLSDENRRAFAVSFAFLYSEVLNNLNRRIEDLDLKAKHGPGSVQDKLRGNQKWTFPRWTRRLQEVFPYEYFCTHTDSLSSGYSVNSLPEDQEPPVKVAFVPKTQKTPRVIAMEPSHMQYMQQAIMTSLVPLLEGSWIGLSQGFSDQEPNRRLARIGSIDRSFATIDLSEASDRVLNTLVLDATRAWPNVQKALQATRSSRSELPSGKIIDLAKFASMGSALCFPIEVMVFSAIVLVGLCESGNYTRKEALELFRRGQVRVYGDDIIVPVDSTLAVEDALESYGLKVNRSKSFRRGYFRESCGGDYFRGTEVTPVRLRRDLPRRRQQAQEIVSINATANLLAAGGYDRASEYLHELLEDILDIYPYVPEGSDLIGRTSVLPQIDRFNRRLFRPEQFGYSIHAAPPRSILSGVRALFKALSGDWSDPMHKDHLERAGRPSSFTLKRTWRGLA